MLVDAAFVVGGLVLLVFGADFLVRGSVALAKRVGVSPLVIGISVVALGTSLPELVVSLRAALAGATGVTAGNIVGSNIANILLIFGAAALLQPFAAARMTGIRDGGAMVVATALFMAWGVAGGYGLFYGLIGIGLLGAYLWYSVQSDRKGGEPGLLAEADEVEEIHGPLWMAIGATVGGLVAVIVGAELLVAGATDLARLLGVSEEVIGLTLVAFGTSVPELATTVAAALRKHADVALGNVLGSNLFNLLGVMGLTGLVVPIPLPEKFLAFDFWILGAATLIIPALILLRGRFGRVEGVTFVALYLGFVAIQFQG